MEEKFIHFTEDYLRQVSKEYHASEKKAVIYTRVSTREQAEKSDALEKQKEITRIHARNEGYAVKAFFGDTWESGQGPDRPQFNLMLKFIKEHQEVKFIIVNEWKTFLRSEEDKVKIQQEFIEKYGVKIVAII